MASLANALKEQISALARREVRRQTAPADKAMARCARDIVALKRDRPSNELASRRSPGPLFHRRRRVTARRRVGHERDIHFRQAVAAGSLLGRSVEGAPGAPRVVCEQLRQAHRRSELSQLGCAQEQRRCLDGNSENRQARSRPTSGEPRPLSPNRSRSRHRPRSSLRTPAVHHPVALSAHCTTKASGRRSQPQSFVIPRRRYHGAVSSPCHAASHRWTSTPHKYKPPFSNS